MARFVEVHVTIPRFNAEVTILPTAVRWEKATTRGTKYNGHRISIVRYNIIGAMKRKYPTLNPMDLSWDDCRFGPPRLIEGQINRKRPRYPIRPSPLPSSPQKTVEDPPDSGQYELF
jgi:hypothetical protein